MKTIREIRLDNLSWMIEVNGGLVKFANFTEISPNQMRQLVGGFKAIGSNLARRIEFKAGAEYGWLDNVHTGNEDVAITSVKCRVDSREIDALCGELTAIATRLASRAKCGGCDAGIAFQGFAEKNEDAA